MKISISTTLRKITLTLLLPITLAGCSSGIVSDNSTHFYSLSSIAPSTKLATQQLRLGVGPIKLPRLLKRPQIITRKNQHQINISEKHQWGGSLKEDITQTVANNLGNLLGTEQVEHFPWKRHFKADYQIRIHIEKMDGELGGKAHLKARWWLRVGNAGTDKLAEYAKYTIEIKGNDYAAYAAALSLLLYQLSQEIAEHIKPK